MAGSCIGKCIFMILNGLLLLIGLAFAAVGVILTFLPDILLDQVYNIVKESLDSFSQNGKVKLPESVDGLKDLPFLHQLGLALLVLGLLLFIVCWLGSIGAGCTSCCRCLLIVFAGCLLVIIMAETATGAMFLVTDSPLHENLRSEFKDQISKEFNETSGDAFSTVIMLFNNYFNCCGIDGVGDFANKTHYSCGSDIGCYTKLLDLIDDNIIWAGLVLAAILSLQLLEVILAIGIFKGANKVSPA